MNNSKLKRKIWLISSIILLSYIVALVINPTTIMALLPIVVITGGLTIVIPAYAIVKNINNEINQKNNQCIKEIETNQYEKNKSFEAINENISNKDYETNNYIEYNDQLDKPKVKTIGQKK